MRGHELPFGLREASPLFRKKLVWKAAWIRSMLPAYSIRTYPQGFVCFRFAYRKAHCVSVRWIFFKTHADPAYCHLLHMTPSRNSCSVSVPLSVGTDVISDFPVLLLCCSSVVLTSLHMWGCKSFLFGVYLQVEFLDHSIGASYTSLEGMRFKF